MKHVLKTLSAVLVFGASALGLQAQPPPRILVVDMAALYDGHYKTEEQNAKLQSDEQLARVRLDQLNAEGTKLVGEYTALEEQARNPALSEEARAKVIQEAQAKMEQIQSKENEVQTFRANIQQNLQGRIQTYREVMLEEISKVATEMAKTRGATILVDKSGPSVIGISNFIYVDPSYDITEAEMAELNKDRPATPAAAPAPAAPTSSTPAPSGDAGVPAVTFPGAKAP